MSDNNPLPSTEAWGEVHLLGQGISPLFCLRLSPSGGYQPLSVGVATRSEAEYPTGSVDDDRFRVRGDPTGAKIAVAGEGGEWFKLDEVPQDDGRSGDGGGRPPSGVMAIDVMLSA